ncbi:slipin family protein [Archangium primigenium]|uniref:slipin family protein n=1 Tax=[Archangium] primigenium TaxID=2792470 RepID=UPI0019582BA0|nr:slipin family protein [Archangium primigenium]MBM7117955.1 slipin family protein [Archangium primigenium]
MDSMTVWQGVLGAVALGGVARAAMRRVVVPEGFCALLYRDGRFVRARPPGAWWSRRRGFGLVLVDMRQRVLTVAGQEVLSQEQVGLKVSLAVRYAVVDAARAQHTVQNHAEALHLAAQLALREEVARHTVEEWVSGRVALGQALRARVAVEAEALGLDVAAVELKDVMLPADLRRAFAETLKSRKEAQARLEKARGESATLRHLANAARQVERQPALMRLRVLQTLEDARGTPGTTFVLGTATEPLPPPRPAKKKKGASKPEAP